MQSPKKLLCKLVSCLSRSNVSGVLSQQLKKALPRHLPSEDVTLTLNFLGVKEAEAQNRTNIVSHIMQTDMFQRSENYLNVSWPNAAPPRREVWVGDLEKQRTVRKK